MRKESIFVSDFSTVASLYTAFALAAATSCLPRLIRSKSQRTLNQIREQVKKATRNSVVATTALSVLAGALSPEIAAASPHASFTLRHHARPRHHWTMPTANAEGVPFSIINNIKISEPSEGFDLAKAQRFADSLPSGVNDHCARGVRLWLRFGGIKIGVGNTFLPYAKYYGAAFDQMPHVIKVASGLSGSSFRARDTLSASEVRLGGYHPTVAVFYNEDSTKPGHILEIFPNGKTGSGFKHKTDSGLASPAQYKYWVAYSIDIPVLWSRATISVRNNTANRHGHYAQWHHHRPHMTTINMASVTIGHHAPANG